MKNLPFFALFACFLAFTACGLDPTNPDPRPQPTASFTIMNGGCNGPCQVVFTNSSTDATSFEWDFGDNSPVSKEVNPVHTYEIAGGYTVKLTAFGPGGADFESKTLQVNAVKFAKTFGGANNDIGRSVQQSSDGGYVLLGYTESEGSGNSDFYLIKTDNVGKLIWKKTFGGVSTEYAYSVQQTSDGGYILLGRTFSEGAGNYDLYLIKTDNVGTLSWKKTFGGADVDYGYSVQQSSDGGYVLLGSTKSEGAGGTDVYLIKTDNAGNLVWKKTFGGADDDFGRSVRQTSDGGYILLGNTSSAGAGASDLYLVKTDNMGDTIWTKTFGGISIDIGHSVHQTSEGGYILLGETQSSGAGAADMYLIKTNNAGNLVWEKTFGGANNEVGYSVQQTSDGGYILLGYTASEGAGSNDWCLIKTDNVGNLVRKKIFGGLSADVGYSVQQTSDGGYILLGHTASQGAGEYDFYLIKTDKDGNAQ